MTARATYAFSRDMTLEVYLQPFVAVGDYSDTRRLARPKSFDFEPVRLDYNPDFNHKSLRSNVVFRWEYKRGSTVYLVWNVSNSDQGHRGEFSAFRDLRTGFGAAGTQVFMVKLNYWPSPKPSAASASSGLGVMTVCADTGPAVNRDNTTRNKVTGYLTNSATSTRHMVPAVSIRNSYGDYCCWNCC